MKPHLVATLLFLTACAESATATPDAGVSSAAAPLEAGAAASGPCDPVAQTCPSPTDKCTLVDPTNSHNVRACVVRTGSVGADQPCRRAADDYTGFGHDDCAAGLSCTYLGVLPPRAGGTRVCRRFCHRDGDCPEDQRCAKVSDATPADGFCGPACQLFGDRCPSGMTCADIWPMTAEPERYFAVCRVTGPVADGGTCEKHEDCGRDRACIPSLLGGSACQSLCDAGHPCAAGVCQVMDPATGAGYCR
jgi:hypothetical protein